MTSNAGLDYIKVLNYLLRPMSVFSLTIYSRFSGLTIKVKLKYLGPSLLLFKLKTSGSMNMLRSNLIYPRPPGVIDVFVMTGELLVTSSSGKKT